MNMKNIRLTTIFLTLLLSYGHVCMSQQLDKHILKTQRDIDLFFEKYDEIYDVVPCGSWEEIEIELKCKDGSIRKASMFPNEEYTDDDYWKSYELLGEHDWNCKTDDVVEWRYLNDWQD